MHPRQTPLKRLLRAALWVGGIVAAAVSSLVLVAWAAYPPGPDWSGEGQALASASCVGEPDASTLVVYLHGYDTVEVSEQERRNRRVLSALAEELGVSFAFPRAHSWRDEASKVLSWTMPEFGSGEVQSLALQWAKILAESRKCAPAYRKLVVLGFSNGGYWVNGAFVRGVLKDASCVVSVGAAGGSWGKAPHGEAGSGNLTMLVGRLDFFNDHRGPEGFERELVARGMARKTYYWGWHWLPNGELARLL